MTVTAAPALRHRRAQPAAHAYTLPVVRELPPRPLDLRDASTW